MDELYRIMAEVALVVCIVLISLCIVWGAGWLNRRRGPFMPDIEEEEP